MENSNTPEQKNPKLWAIARKRAGFKRDLVIYLIVNAFLWAIWLLTDDDKRHGIPWPVWSTLGWGLGILFQYINAYRFPRESLAEREYEKLKKQS
ncbi:MAG TPA: 2TM domain-containing protein [Chitinophagaceae bacterium]|nr:2TM domain-containing protein [Chitinophagaceae bacterium]